MHKRIEIALRVSSACLVLAGYLSLASVPEYGILLMAIPLLAILFGPLGEWLDSHATVYRWLSKGLLIACLLVIPFAVAGMPLLHAVIALIIFVQVHILLHRKTISNYYYSYLMAFFLLLAACVQEPEAWAGIAMALFLFSAVWALLSLRLHVEATRPGTVSAAEILRLDKGPGPGFSSRPVFSAGMIFSISLLSLGALALTAVVFLVAPRTEAGFLRRNPNDVQPTSSRRLDLDQMRGLSADESLVMSVRFPGEPGQMVPNEDALYWRTYTLAQYHQSQWGKAPLEDDLEPATEQKGEVVRASRRRGRARPDNASRIAVEGVEIIVQDIFLREPARLGLPCLDLVQSVDIAGGVESGHSAWDSFKDFSVVLSSGTPPPSIRYTAFSEIRVPDPEELRAAENNYLEKISKADYDLLTHQELLPETIAMAKAKVQNGTNAYDQVNTLCGWLQGSGFAYTLNPPVYPEGSGIDHFIMRDRLGDCQYFSSALTLMVRALGIPARLVCGYHGGQWNRQDRSYIVRKSMAHAWTEVYFPDYGWVRFDPTPSSASISANPGARLVRFLTRLSTRTELFWLQEVIRFDHGRQAAWFRNLRLSLFNGLPTPSLGNRNPFAPARLAIWSTLFPVLLVAGIFGYAGVKYFSRRPARRSHIFPLTADQRRAARLYTKFRRRLSKLGLGVGACSTGEIADELKQRDWQGLEEAQRLLRAYNEARFGGRPLPKTACVRLGKSMGAVLPPA